MFPLPHTDKYVGICGSNLNFKTLQPSKCNEWNQRIVDQTQIPCKKNKKKIWQKGNSRKRKIRFLTFSIYLLLVIANYWTYEIIFISLPISFYICLFFIIFFALYVFYIWMKAPNLMFWVQARHPPIIKFTFSLINLGLTLTKLTLEGKAHAGILKCDKVWYNMYSVYLLLACDRRKG